MVRCFVRRDDTTCHLLNTFNQITSYELLINDDLVTNDMHESHMCLQQLGFATIPDTKPTLADNIRNPSNVSDDTAPEDSMSTTHPIIDFDRVMRDLHTLLIETEVREGKMVCGNCGHEYKIKEGIANFLLPSHLGQSWIPFMFSLY